MTVGNAGRDFQLKLRDLGRGLRGKPKKDCGSEAQRLRAMPAKYFYKTSRSVSVDVTKEERVNRRVMPDLEI